MISEGIPGECDWGMSVDADRDVRYAHDVFIGKSNEEMMNEFKRSLLMRCADLRVMPLIPFRYYVIGFRNYIRAGDFGAFNKEDAGACFLELVESKLEVSPEYILPIANELMPTAEYIANNQSFFEADEDLYGSFMNKFNNIKRLVGKWSGGERG